MTDIPTIAESAEFVIWSAKVGIAASVFNMIGGCLIIYGAFMLRKGTKALEEGWRALRDAQGVAPVVSPDEP